MSLLLEALKKAELAKQTAMAEQTAVQTPVEPPDRGLRKEPVFTRAHLPDINETLDIRAEDLGELVMERVTVAPPVAAIPAPEIPPQEPRRTERPAELDIPPPGAPAALPPREAARQLFDAKEASYNPRRPFHITMAALVVAAMAYGGYAWWQVQPRYPSPVPAMQSAAASVSRQPVTLTGNVGAAQSKGAITVSAPAAGIVPPTVAALAVTSASSATTPGTTPVQGPGPGAQPSGTSPPASASLQIAPAIPTARPPATISTTPAARPPAQAARSASSRPAAPLPESRSITITPPSLQTNEAMDRAYAAYQRGELEEARREYEAMIAREPTNRDALLGLAGIDLRTRSFETAEMRYLRLLELDPRDSYANAGLIALHGATNPVQSESRIKSLLANQPDATHLYFSLGNQYASQSRWTEAQDAYFKAHSAYPDNPDFAYNLAVSLDHLGQPRLALDYYRKALGLASQRVPAFDRARAEVRARELAR